MLPCWRRAYWWIRGCIYVSAVVIIMCLLDHTLLTRIHNTITVNNNELWDASIRDRVMHFDQEVQLTLDDKQSLKKQQLIDFLDADKALDYNYINMVNSRNQPRHKYTVRPTVACSNDAVTLVVVVTSAAHHSVRNVIRNTWATPLDSWPVDHDVKGRYHVIFAMGLDSDPMWNEVLILENQDHGDILQGVDNDLLSTPHVLPTFVLSWAQDYCPAARYLTYLFTDMFIYMPSVIEFLNNLNWLKLFIIPKEIINVSKENATSDYYKVASGKHVFIMTSDLIRDIHAATDNSRINVDRDLPFFAEYAQHFGAFIMNTGKLTIGPRHVTSTCDILLGRILLVRGLTEKQIAALWQRVQNKDISTCS